MPSIPDSTKSSLHQRLSIRARERWPTLTTIAIRYRAGFAYIDAVLPNAEVLPLCRLRYSGSASIWGFAISWASHEDYEDSYLPTASMGAPPPKTPSTPPAGSTSVTPLPEPEPPTNLRP